MEHARPKWRGFPVRAPSELSLRHSDTYVPPSHASEADAELFAPVLGASRRFYVTVGILSAIVVWAFIAWLIQYNAGLGVTGLNRPIYWGFYITNFVFFIGISHAGTLISAILRLCKAEWRRSITRSAEVITVLVLFFGVANVLMDLGRPDRALNVIQHGQFRSPLLWDVTSISTYLTASAIYLFLPLIPDIALVRDKLIGYARVGRRVSRLRLKFYSVLSVGWTGSEKQQQRLERAITVMAVLVIPIAVSVHTVVSWVFAMTIQPMWHSTIFGPYFVAGAIFSGIAALLIAMAIIRRVYHLEDYLKPVHFNNLGILLLVMTLLWFYFTFAEHLTSYYGAEPAHMKVFWEKISGHYAVEFWSMAVLCFVIPLSILARRKTRTVTGTVIASISVTIGMWLERFTIVVPTLINPRLPYERGAYHPTWVEVSITVGCFAMFILLYVVFTKVFPIVSIWEVREGQEKAIKETGDRIRGYLPGGAAAAD
ncbi:MAG TPA: NrfD/PsrC family molybdoenzyme membrane anchor subunit [Blastocatellia bacterium]|nr:NrfD/PsrC family molybdoenzyme membrane anchor subunit [Blastocatellia bacterium]